VPTESRFVRVYSDGAAKGNPGPAGAGAVIVASDGQVIAELGRYLGEQTNNVAEYEGLLLGLRHALKHGATEVEVLADSQLLIRQLSGVYRVRNAGLIPLFEEAKRLLRNFKKVELRHIPREQNGAADEMSNRAIDERMSD
jgi:ribonuclease HI